jgi:hypothetical protein
MAASDHLGLQFAYHDMGNDHSIVGTDAGGFPKANLDWSKHGGQRFGQRVEPGEVTYLHVHSSMTHQGIATHMWNMAKGLDSGIRHSSNQTEDGAGWARAVGD